MSDLSKSKLDPGVSRQVLSAIQGALEEEKIPTGQRILKAVVWGSACTLILALPLGFAFREQMSAIWLGATALWWLCLCVGFYLHFYPQPRLAVPGFWSPWVFAKLLIAMVGMTALEILLCPSFVFLESPLEWNPFERLTALFMDWGGMAFCMFACGVIFSSIGGLASFLLVSRTLRQSTGRDLLRATAVASMTQLPILGVQIFDGGLRPFAAYWMGGAVLGTFVMARGVSLGAAWKARRALHLSA